jgi:hypothetical protein
MTLRTSYNKTTDRFMVSDGVHWIEDLTVDEYLEFRDALTSGRHTPDYMFRVATRRHLTGAA